jgi:putative zinc finger protein
MNDISCGYEGDREGALIAYLYDDIDPVERSAFGAHLGSCARCRHDLDALGGVRTRLAHWSPPEPQFAIGRQSVVPGDIDDVDRRASVARRRAWWHEIPAWAQVAAAMLFLGVSAAIANLDVRYDPSGLTVRTGWSKSSASTPAAANTTLATNSTPWRADLVALEGQLRTEFHATQVVAPAAMAVGLPAGRSSATEGELLRRLKGMIDESARRQESELALRIAEVIRDMNTQRQADLRKIDQNLGLIQDRTGVEVFKNREMVNYLMQRVSQRQ